ncbi:MAG: hypothetical protein EB015_10300 [Methylocystaceae bacterium]|nr:hypothetical protein [Methylocystaceae bacterium]
MIVFSNLIDRWAKDLQCVMAYIKSYDIVELIREFDFVNRIDFKNSDLIGTSDIHDSLVDRIKAISCSLISSKACDLISEAIQ